jgi:hypothetical protein
MITIFAVPKSFSGHIATIQRNAIASWRSLLPSCQVLLFGNEDGTAQIARELGVSHVPEVRRTEFGTPLLNDVFEKAERLARHELLCYVNCDIILMADFLESVREVYSRKRRFLMVGQCWNLDVTEILDLKRPDWEGELRKRISERATRRPATGIDYFAFSKGFYGTLPPFALGRAYFDNWLIWKARSLRGAVVDASDGVTAVHQNHDYAHVSGGRRWAYSGEEAMINLALAGGLRHKYLTYDANFKLVDHGLKRNLGGYFRLWLQWERILTQLVRLRDWGTRWVPQSDGD